MTKLFKNDLFLPHDSVVKAGSGAQLCGDIHYVLLHLEGGGGPSYFNDIRLYILHVIYLYMYHCFKKTLQGKPRSYITSLWVLCCLLGRDNSERKLLLDFIQKVVLWATTQSMTDVASGSTIQLELTGNENNGGKYKKWNFIRNIVYILSS